MLSSKVKELRENLVRLYGDPELWDALASHKNIVAVDEAFILLMNEALPTVTVYKETIESVPDPTDDYTVNRQAMRDVI